MKASLEEIKTFLNVVETGSISSAAVRLNVSKSVISQRVSQLERALGASLLNRSSRGVVPTDRGQEYYEKACAALSMLDQAAEAVVEDEASLSGQLRITAPMSFGTRYLGPILFEFMQKHPRLALSLDLDDRALDLLRGGFDLAVRITRLSEDSPLIASKLADSRRVVCCSHSYGAAHPLPQSLEDILQHDCIGYTHADMSHLWEFEPATQGGVIRAVTPRGRIVANNGEAMRDAAVAGLGLAVLPLFIVAEDLKAGRLIPVLRDEIPLPDAIYVAYPPRRHTSVKLKAVAQHLREAFSKKPSWDRLLGPGA